MRILKGRFGPYVTDGVVNASIPSGRDPEAITFDDAIELIAAREAKLREQGQDPRAPKASGRSGSRTTRRSSSRSSSPRRRSA